LDIYERTSEQNEDGAIELSQSGRRIRNEVIREELEISGISTIIKVLSKEMATVFGKDT
jgi:hypothetical protein